MSEFETSATVEEHGRVLLDGVPFAPGTEVDITITVKPLHKDQLTTSDDESLTAARERMRQLFHTTKGFRNSPRIPREELYERGCLH
ncbi:MAG: hypothetical protein O2955_06520 [Planctomycetota bacterium]|nr:hypothetical protein [Planctomycetota bacterium]MDA1212148.1 hypothetical protein [Planctomycetota bacterium]